MHPSLALAGIIWAIEICSSDVPGGAIKYIYINFKQ